MSRLDPNPTLSPSVTHRQVTDMFEPPASWEESRNTGWFGELNEFIEAAYLVTSVTKIWCLPFPLTIAPWDTGPPSAPAQPWGQLEPTTVSSESFLLRMRKGGPGW